MKFDVIYADPPWQYNARRNTNTAFGGGSSSKFSQLSLGRLAALSIEKIAADNCVLFMWGVWPKLVSDVIPLISVWGFEYSTLGFLWVKTTSDGSRVLAGPGSYTGSNTEPCFLARRGRYLEPSQHLVPQVYQGPRLPGYAQKPQEIQERIDLMYPDPLMKLELFARKQADEADWCSIGNEISGRDIVLDLQDLIDA